MITQHTFSEAIREAIYGALAADESVICFGLGVPDPKGIFGTTTGLQETFGSQRVFDIPTSENALTGVAIGVALGGYKPLMIHQRLDFALLAMDQIINGAAKWHYMFGGQFKVPVTFRLIIGKGWGQGPTHSQSLQALFAHIPGLIVLMPSMPSDAKNYLYSAILNPNPVVFLEHRWLHSVAEENVEPPKLVDISRSRLLRAGSDVTIISASFLSIEAMQAAEHLSEFGFEIEIIDLISIKPLDWDTIYQSVDKTGAVLVLDTGYLTGSVSAEIITCIVTERFGSLKKIPARLASPDVPEPTAFCLTKEFHISTADIVNGVLKLLDVQDTAPILKRLKSRDPHDVPGDWFKGPF